MKGHVFLTVACLPFHPWRRRVSCAWHLQFLCCSTFLFENDYRICNRGAVASISGEAWIQIEIDPYTVLMELLCCQLSSKYNRNNNCSFCFTNAFKYAVSVRSLIGHKRPHLAHLCALCLSVTCDFCTTWRVIYESCFLITVLLLWARAHLNFKCCNSAVRLGRNGQGPDVIQSLHFLLRLSIKTDEIWKWSS